MPQMMPMYWLIMLMIMTLTLILSTILLYFFFLPASLMTSSTRPQMKMIKPLFWNWKW